MLFITIFYSIPTHFFTQWPSENRLSSCSSDKVGLLFSSTTNVFTLRYRARKTITDRAEYTSSKFKKVEGGRDSETIIATMEIGAR